MTDELKTLKDIPKIEYVGDYVEDLTAEQFCYELKAEAVKWVKEIDKIDFRETLKTKDKQVVINKLNKESIKNWIKGFFNLTEEDLK